MIGYVRGIVRLQPSLTGTEPALIDVNGVGYNVYVADPTLSVGADVELYVHTIVRADALLLYGFGSLEERRTFETLLATPGVGPSTALAALRTLGLSALTSAIESGDVKAVASVPGIGPKTASRIVLELKGKLVFVSPDRAARSVSSGRGDIEDALRALGYSTGEIRDGLRDVELPTDESQALKVALQLVRRS